MEQQKKIKIFERELIEDQFNRINQTDNTTVIITPKYNTTNKTELKVKDVTFFYIFILTDNRLVYYCPLVKRMIT